MNILLRDAIAADFESIANLLLQAYREYATKLTEQNWQKMATSISNVRQTANVANFIVAESESEIAGAIAYYSPGKSNPQFFDSRWASLRLLAVSPKYRGRGIGKQLIQEGVVRAKKDGANGVGLYTSEIMTTAAKMYDNLGFVRVRELPSMLGLRYWLYLLPIE